MVGSPNEFVAHMEWLANGPYRYGSWDCSDRCNPEVSGCADCSGSVCWALRKCGVDIGCEGSFSLARMCHAASSGITQAQARATPGSLLYIGVNEGQGGRPGIDPGHIAVSRGDGTTVEARNHVAGICISRFDGRGWSYYARPFWLDEGTPDPGDDAQPGQEDDWMRVIPLKKVGVAGNAQPYLAFDPHGGPTKRGVVLSWHGARIHWDVNAGDAGLGGTQDPKTIGIPGGPAQVLDVVPLSPINASSVRICAYGLNAGEWYGTAHI